MEAVQFAATLASWKGGGGDLKQGPTALPHIITSAGRCVTAADITAVSRHPEFEADSRTVDVSSSVSFFVD